ncbi:hypothetical protein [Paraburkholderia sp. BR10882]|uniref:hypothetical protein n=1 Tax=unclassified Paraburkholderia TaxID=2615204 RepID=UPI0034CDA4DE
MNELDPNALWTHCARTAGELGATLEFLNVHPALSREMRDEMRQLVATVCNRPIAEQAMVGYCLRRAKRDGNAQTEDPNADPEAELAALRAIVTDIERRLDAPLH